MAVKDKKLIIPDPAKFNSAESLYAFVGWLATRHYRVIISSTDSMSEPAVLMKRFCEHYKLPEPRPGWENLIKPIKEGE